jgi:ribonuclease HI
MLEIYTDGASRGNPGKSAIAYVFVKAGKVVELHSEKIDDATNNIAEYKAIIKALTEANSRGYNEINLFSDSLLVISQIRGDFKIKSPHLLQLLNEVNTTSKNFQTIEFRHVDRENKFIKIADNLCTIILGPK